MGALGPYFLFQRPRKHPDETNGPNKPATDGALEIGNGILTPNVKPPRIRTPYTQREYLILLFCQYVRLNEEL